MLASFYNEDIVDFDDIKSWYAKALNMKKQGGEASKAVMSNLDDTMQQAMRLIQQIHELEQDDDDDDDDEESE